MLCLSDSIRHDASSVQQLLSTIEEAQTLTQLMLAVWPLARVLAVHIIAYVLAQRAQRPLPSLCGPLPWRRRVGQCPRGCDIPQVAPLDEALAVQP
jgi:hypothetical protein